MPAESYVQVATDGSGKKIRNRVITEEQAVDASGNAQTDLVRYQQVVTHADERGDIVDVSLADVVSELAKMNQTMTAILEELS